MMRLGPLAATLALLMAPAADALSKEVKKYLNSAAALYENLDYEKALKQLERARSKSRGAEDDQAIALYEGIVLADMGREEKALAAFKLGLSMDPDAKLPLDVSPKVEATFEQARSSVKKLLAPQLEQQRLEEEERRRVEAERLRQAEEKARAEAARPTVDVVEPSPPSSRRKYAWMPAAGGAVLAGAGAFFLLQAKGNYDGLMNGTVAPENATGARDQGKTQQTLGLALTGAGAAALVAAGVLLAMPAPESQASLFVGEGGAFVLVSGTLP